MELRAADMVDKHSTTDHAFSPLLCVKKQNTFKTMACKCSFGGGNDDKNRSFTRYVFLAPLKEK